MPKVGGGGGGGGRDDVSAFFRCLRLKRMMAIAIHATNARPPSTPPTMAPVGGLDFLSGVEVDDEEGDCWAGERGCVDGVDVVRVVGVEDWEAVDDEDVDVGAAEDEDDEGFNLRTKPRLGAIGPLIL